MIASVIIALWLAGAAAPRDVVYRTERIGDRDIDFRGQQVRLNVSRIWKGEPGARIDIVYTHHDGESYRRFARGQRVIVWADEVDGHWLTTDCAPTIERERATPALLAFLDTLKK